MPMFPAPNVGDTVPSGGGRHAVFAVEPTGE